MAKLKRLQHENARLKKLVADKLRSLEEATNRIEEWRRIYNEIRPHSRLGYQPPASGYFLERFQAHQQAA